MANITRRNLLGLTASAIVAGPTIALSSGLAFASDEPRLDPSDAQAKALAYMHQSEQSGSNCANCQLYSGGADADWGPCAIFPGKQVAAAGWCSAWVKRAG
jgi:hypothetical protein